MGLPPIYVMDEMRYYEISEILENGLYKNRESWEQTRMLMYIISQIVSKNKLSLDDIIKFPWDKENIVNHDDSIKSRDIDRLTKKIESYIKSKVCQQI